MSYRWRIGRRRRQAARAALTRRQLVLPPPLVSFEVVGEEACQGDLALVVRRRVREGRDLEVAVVLRFPADPSWWSTVECWVEGRLVGRLNRVGAVAVRPFLAATQAQGRRVGLMGRIVVATPEAVGDGSPYYWVEVDPPGPRRRTWGS